MLHGLEVHFEPFKMDQKQFWPRFDHQLASCNLLGVTAFAVKLVSQVKQLFCAEFLQTITQADILFDIHRKVHECLFSGTLPLAGLTSSNGNQFSLKHQLHPSFKLWPNFLFNQILNFFAFHLGEVWSVLELLSRFLCKLLALQLFDEEEFVVFHDIHVDLVYEPTDELVRVVMLVIVEEGIACSDSGNESAMVDHTSICFSCIVRLE